MSGITKNNLVSHLKTEVGLGDSESKKFLESFFYEIVSQVRDGNNIKLYGFGTFSKSVASKKYIRSINTGEIKEIVIPSKIKFKRSKKKA